MTTVERPDVNDPFTYTLSNISEDTLLLMMHAMNTQYGQIDWAISQHAECNKLLSDGCKVLEKDFGRRGSCFQELQTLHQQAQDIIAFLEGARFVRENREIKSEQSFRDLQAKARYATEAAVRSLQPTGHYEIIQARTGAESIPAEAQAPSDTYTGRYELSDQQLDAAERIRNGLKREGVIDTDGKTD
jgi:hypothetical protein